MVMARDMARRVELLRPGLMAIGMAFSKNGEGREMDGRLLVVWKSPAEVLSEAVHSSRQPQIVSSMTR